MNSLSLPVIPVMDLLNGRVVRAVAGDRANYRLVVSRLAPEGASTGAIAANLLTATGSSELYVADLDAIQGGAMQVTLLHEIAATGATLLVDVGLRRPPLPVAPRRIRWVVGTETWADPAELPTGPLTLSLDMRGGELLASAAWGGDPVEAVRRASEVAELAELIVLDLAQVGVGGRSTLGLVTELRRLLPTGVRLIAGGGVRGAADLAALRDAGADAALVASALHDGRLTTPTFPTSA